MVLVRGHRISTYCAGISVVGEAIIAKSNEEAWFLFGTFGLILVNLGLCFFGTAVGLRYGNRV